MITLYVILFVLLLVTTYIFALYVSWKVSEGATFAPISLHIISPEMARAMRLIRRGWYSSTFYGKQAALWSNKKVAHLFVKVVPSAKPAFEKKDALTGLTHGPSSFYLQSISESKKEPKKRLFSHRKAL